MDRVALQSCSYGVYVVCAKKDGKFNGQIVNTVFQITSEPPTVSVSINKQNLTHEYIDAGKVFTVSVLSQETPMSFIGHFGFKSGREINKLEGIKYKLGVTQAPVVLDYAVARMEARIYAGADSERVAMVVLAEGEEEFYGTWSCAEEGRFYLRIVAEDRAGNGNSW